MQGWLSLIRDPSPGSWVQRRLRDVGLHILGLSSLWADMDRTPRCQVRGAGRGLADAAATPWRACGVVGQALLQDPGRRTWTLGAFSPWTVTVPRDCLYGCELSVRGCWKAWAQAKALSGISCIRGAADEVSSFCFEETHRQLVLISPGRLGQGGQEVCRTQGSSCGPRARVTPGSSEAPPEDLDARHLPGLGWSAAVRVEVPGQGARALSHLSLLCSPPPSSPEAALTQ